MIGFLGGSFDPVHYGHLQNARAIKKELSLQQLFLMPCKAPVHKKPLYFSNKQRLDMLNLALQEFDDLSVDRREIDRKSASYTIDSLKQIKQDYPNKKIFLIIGADSFAMIDTWKNYQEFEQYAKIVVLPRTANKSNSNYPSSVYLAKTPLLNISSTQIRTMLFDSDLQGKMHAGQNLTKLIPNNIIDYINNL